MRTRFLWRHPWASVLIGFCVVWLVYIVISLIYSITLGEIIFAALCIAGLAGMAALAFLRP